MTVEDFKTARKNRNAQRERPDWLDHCLTTATGTPIPELANVEIGLRLDPDLQDLFGYDEMIGKPMIMNWLDPESWNGPEPVTDVHVSKVQLRLQRAGLPRIGRDTVYQAIELRARDLKYHPVRDYLRGLEWDRTARLATWLSYYLGAEASEYASAAGRMFLTSAVARIFEPGCQADYTLVLAGHQGILKSRAVAALAGEWASDGLPDIRDKDALLHLDGRWIIEIPELSAIGKADSEALKAFLTRRVDRYRPPYGRIEIQRPRQCCFIASTNEYAFLKDVTGNRRFWPVDVNSIDIDALEQDRDQLFAEAVRLYDAGIPWWPDRVFEAEHIVPQQEARLIEDPWRAQTAGWMAGRDEATTAEVAQYALDIKMERITSQTGRRIADIMRGLGFAQRKSHGVRKWTKS